MQIMTLGTSHGAAEIGRTCSGTLVTVNGASYLFDCGGSMEAKLTDMNFPLNTIRCVFISHMHEDHVGSLSAIAKRFTHYIKTGETVKLYMPEEDGIIAFKNWLKAMHIPETGKLEFNIVNAGVIYSDENIKVSAILTEHLFNGEFPSYAYVIEAEGKKVLYSGDLSCDFHDYPQIVFEEDFDAIVCELVHFDVDKNLDTIAKSRTKQIIFTHMSPRKLPAMLENIDKFPFPVHISGDGRAYEI